jgi:hypothetical protein
MREYSQGDAHWISQTGWQAQGSACPHRIRGPSSRLPALAIDLAAEEIGTATDDPIDKKGAVEVVHLVLDCPGLVTLHLELQGHPPGIKGTQANLASTNDVAGVIGDGQAALAGHLEAIPVGNLGIDQDQIAMVWRVLAAGDIHDDDPLEDVDLGRGDAHRRRPGLTGLLQIGDEGTQLIVEVGNGRGDLAQPLVRQGKDFE